MSTPAATTEVSTPTQERVSRKRSLSFTKVDELDQMHPLKLTAQVLDFSDGVRQIRKLPASVFGGSAGDSEVESKPAATPECSQNSRLTDGMSSLQILESAEEYLVKRISAAKAAREERYLEESPPGSQNSFVVSYSQDSQMSGDEPPQLKVVINVILDQLPEERLQQVFPLEDVDDTDGRLRVATKFLDSDLVFLNDLVKETKEAMKGASDVIRSGTVSETPGTEADASQTEFTVTRTLS